MKFDTKETKKIKKETCKLSSLRGGIENLEKYRKALSENDSETMKKLIKEGSELKYQNLRKRVGESN